MSDLIGQTLGNYLIEALLGIGGVGQVFRARDIRLRRMAAIKVMHESLASDSQFKARFLQEATAIAALHHENVIEIFHFDEHFGQLYIAMELMAEGSLRHLLQAADGVRRPQLLPQLLRLICQAADALGFAHENRMVHRDVKPENMLLNSVTKSKRFPDGLILKISDFGLVRLQEQSAMTTTGTPLGTPPYMSPEQCRVEQLDGRSDVYSLGVVLYEAASGLRPFHIRSFDDAFRHIQVEPRAPLEVCPDLPPELNNIILRCLAKRPENRPTADNLAAELRRIIDAHWPQPNNGTSIHQIPTLDPILLEANPKELVLTPGQPAALSLTIGNFGRDVHHFSIVAKGMPETWVAVPHQPLQLLPGMRTTAAVNFNVPRNSGSLARDYQLSLRAYSREQSELFAEIRIRCTVKAFSDFGVELFPHKAAGRTYALYDVHLSNNGNRPATYELAGKDQEGVLRFTFQDTPITLDAGGGAHVKLTVQAPRRWIGLSQVRSFTIRSRHTSANRESAAEVLDAPREIPGQLVHRALIAAWMPPAVAMVAALLGLLWHKGWLWHSTSPPILPQVYPIQGGFYYPGQEVFIPGKALPPAGGKVFLDNQLVESKWSQEQVVFTVPRTTKRGLSLPIRVEPSAKMELNGGSITVKDYPWIIPQGGNRNASERVTIPGGALGTDGKVFLGGVKVDARWRDTEITFVIPKGSSGQLAIEVLVPLMFHDTPNPIHLNGGAIFIPPPQSGRGPSSTTSPTPPNSHSTHVPPPIVNRSIWLQKAYLTCSQGTTVRLFGGGLGAGGTITLNGVQVPAHWGSNEVDFTLPTSDPPNQKVRVVVVSGGQTFDGGDILVAEPNSGFSCGG